MAVRALQHVDGAGRGDRKPARRLADLPETTAALANGRIGSGHARVAADTARDLPADARAGLDRLAADEGQRTDPSALRKRADDYAHRTAPVSLAERERRAFERRRLATHKTADGGLAVDARLPVEGGEALLAALAPLAAPKGPDDGRTAEQRAADALTVHCGRVAAARRGPADSGRDRLAAARAGCQGQGLRRVWRPRRLV